jgi:hypothetical protein
MNKKFNQRRKTMKKTIIVLALLAVMLTTVGIGSAAAQGEGPGTSSLRGPLHDYIIEAFAAQLDLDVDDVNTAIDSGQTLYQVALANGVAAEDYQALMQEVFSTALTGAVADGVITQERADWMLQHMQSRGTGSFGAGRGMMGGSGTGTCPMRDGDDDGQVGPGMMQGHGRGGGGRWLQTNP